MDDTEYRIEIIAGKGGGQFRGSLFGGVCGVVYLNFVQLHGSWFGFNVVV